MYIIPVGISNDPIIELNPLIKPALHSQEMKGLHVFEQDPLSLSGSSGVWH